MFSLNKRNKIENLFCALVPEYIWSGWKIQRFQPRKNVFKWHSLPYKHWLETRMAEQVEVLTADWANTERVWKRKQRDMPPVRIRLLQKYTPLANITPGDQTLLWQGRSLCWSSCSCWQWSSDSSLDYMGISRRLTLTSTADWPSTIMCPLKEGWRQTPELLLWREEGDNYNVVSWGV